MATLHIEHAITDLPTWLGAFSRFGQARADAGVRPGLGGSPTGRVLTHVAVP